MASTAPRTAVHEFKKIEKKKRESKEKEQGKTVSGFSQNGANALLKLNFIIRWQPGWQEVKSFAIFCTTNLLFLGRGNYPHGGKKKKKEKIRHLILG